MDDIKRGDRVLIMARAFQGRVGSIDRVGGDSVTVVIEVFDRDMRVGVAPSDLATPANP